MSILQSEAGSANLREVAVRLLDASGAPVTGLAGSVTIKVAKAGDNTLGAGGAGTVLTEVTAGASGGGYRLTFDAADIDTPGMLHYEITHASIVPVYDAVYVRPALRAVDLATDSISAAKVAADAVTKIQAGLALQTGIDRLLHLMHENAMIDNVVYGAQGIITAARLRGFANAAALAAATPGAGNGADGETTRFVITGVDAGGGAFSSYKISRSV